MLRTACERLSHSIPLASPRLRNTPSAGAVPFSSARLSPPNATRPMVACRAASCPRQARQFRKSTGDTTADLRGGRATTQPDADTPRPAAFRFEGRSK